MVDGYRHEAWGGMRAGSCPEPISPLTPERAEFPVPPLAPSPKALILDEGHEHSPRFVIEGMNVNSAPKSLGIHKAFICVIARLTADDARRRTRD